MTKKILIVAAHPDDEVLGCFATVAKLIREGYKAYTLILSCGKSSRGKVKQEEYDILQQEMIAANKLIGISEVFCEKFPDNAFDSVSILEIVKKIEYYKSKLNPDIIFTHHEGDMNIDHQITHKAVLTATRPMEGEPVKTIYAMEVPSSTEWNSFCARHVFIANVFFDVSDTINEKVKAMSLYKSELRQYPHPRSLQYIENLSKLSGAKVGLKYSENFILVRNING